VRCGLKGESRFLRSAPVRGWQPGVQIPRHDAESSGWGCSGGALLFGAPQHDPRLQSYRASQSTGLESGQFGSQREGLELISRQFSPGHIGSEARD
jgi:hypothetical protein